MTHVRIPNEGEKITHRPASGTQIYLTVRRIHRKMLGYEPRFEAELRDLVGDAYLPVGRVSRETKEAAVAAAHALASRRGWGIIDKRLGWAIYDAGYERRLVEAAEDFSKGTCTAAPEPAKPPPLLFAEFVAEMHEILRESRATPGRDLAIYYGDMLRRLEDAIDLVNARITSRGGLLLRELGAEKTSP